MYVHIKHLNKVQISYLTKIKIQNHMEPYKISNYNNKEDLKEAT